MTGGKLQIGELARRTGLKPSLIRAWEVRYGLLNPARTAGGTRLYTLADVAQLRTMTRYIDQGFSASQAAASVLERSISSAAGGEEPQSARADASELERGGQALRSAFAALDPVSATVAFNYLLSNFRYETIVRVVVLPYLRDVGGRWERGEASIAEEHFASSILRARFLSMATLDRASPSHLRAVLACPPGEHHDLALVILGASLARRGWEVSILGADTPFDALAQAVRQLGAETVVISAVFRNRLDVVTDDIKTLTSSSRVQLAGPAVSEALIAATGACWLVADPITAADQLSVA